MLMLLSVGFLFQLVQAQPDGGGGDMSCADLDAEMCELIPFCELSDEGCVEADWDGGGNGDGDHDGGGDGGGGDMSCADLDAEMCELIPFCELSDEGCVEADWDGWGMGNCGDSTDEEWGCGDWNWEDGGFSLGDINMDDFINVQDIINEVTFILDEAIPSDYESWAGDLNIDDILNVLDVVDLIEIILGARSINGNAEALIDDCTIIVNGSVGAIQAKGSLISNVVGSDILASANGNTVIYNLNGVLDTDSFTFTSTPTEVIIASTSGKQVDVKVSIPKSISLGKAYPNPFNPSTAMDLNLSDASFVSMQVVNVKGQIVSTLVDGYMDAGYHSITWDAQNMTSGMYFVKVEANGELITQKLMLVK